MQISRMTPQPHFGEAAKTKKGGFFKNLLGIAALAGMGFAAGTVYAGSTVTDRYTAVLKKADAPSRGGFMNVTFIVPPNGMVTKSELTSFIGGNKSTWMERRAAKTLLTHFDRIADEHAKKIGGIVPDEEFTNALRSFITEGDIKGVAAVDGDASTLSSKDLASKYEHPPIGHGQSLPPSTPR